ncbi:MAG: efflux RND transporter permease subunit, partial [Peptococcaceae bacterium]|nr:efflux RND transporter permease subunit [Peptococcaceae bacterium]
VEVGSKLKSIADAQNMNLVIVEQDMSSLSNAFKSVGDGFGAVGDSLSKIGAGLGNLTQGQMLLQAQIQLSQGISGLTAKLALEQTTLAGYAQQLALAQQAQPQDLNKIGYLQQEIAQTKATAVKNDAQLKSLQKQLSSIQAQLQHTGADTVSVLKSLPDNASASGDSALEVKPVLRIRVIKLGDIAKVSYAADKDSVINRLNGQPAVVLGIEAQAGTNVVDLIKQVNAKLAELVLPQGYKLTKLRNSAQQIKSSVSSMQREAILGALFAMLITFVFLRNWRSTIVAVLSIPLSIFASLITLYLLNYSLNIMTLAGIAVAVGRVVDDSIVVIENIYRRVRLSEERSPELVAQATTEVGQAVTSSTITTVAVFAPLMFVPGIVGKYFRPFGIAVMVSIIFSLLVAMTVVPLVAKLFLLNIKQHESRENTLQRGYRLFLRWALRHKLLVTGIATLVFAGSLLLLPQIPQNFLPTEKTVSYNLQVTMPVGTASEKTDALASKVENFLHGRSDVKSYQTLVSGEELAVSIEMQDEIAKVDTNKFEQDLQQATEKFDSDATVALTPVGIASGYGGLVMILKGTDISSLHQAGDMIERSIKDVPGLSNVHTNLSAVKPQLSIEVDPAAAAKHGLNPAMVAMSVRQMLEGDSVMTVELAGNPAEVNLGLQADGLDTLDTIRSLHITNMTGERIKLADIAAVSIQPGPTSIQRLNQQEYVSVEGRFTTDNSSGVQKAVETRVSTLVLPPGVSYSYAGESKEMQDGFTNLGLAMIIAVLLVYMVMLVAFGEMLAPLAILFALPFIMVGGLAGLYISGESLGVPAMVGFLMLIGIVVTNAIVLVDRVLQNRQSGMERETALLEAGVTRLRPILMTAVATVCALLPLAVSSEGGLISRSMAIVVISGLATSTILTLVIVPVAYQGLDGVRTKLLGSADKGLNSIKCDAK